MEKSTTKKFRPEVKQAAPVLDQNDNSVPISLRLKDGVITELKRVARKASYERDSDVSYVDLIREAIYSLYNISEASLPESNDKIEDFFSVLRTDRGFWTNSEIEEFERSKIGKSIKDAIDSHDYVDFTNIFAKTVSRWVRENSIGQQILRWEKNHKFSPHNPYIIGRDVASIAHVVARRGAVPDQIVEGESIIVPSFEIAGLPSIRYPEMKANILLSMISMIGLAIQKELDTNVLKALSSAADQRKDQVIDTSNAGCISPQHFLKAFQHIAQHNVAPSSIIMHVNDYIGLKSFGSEFLNAPPLPLAIQRKDWGDIMGVKIRVSERMEPGTILVTGTPSLIGSVIREDKVSVRHIEDAKKLRHEWVVSTEVGIVIIADYLISKITDAPQKQQHLNPKIVV